MAVTAQAGPDALCGLGVAELGRRYRAGELSPVDVTRATLDRIERLNPILNAYITVLADSALAAARAAEEQLAAGIDLGPLHGVPCSVKDIIAVRGVRSTAASRILRDAPPEREDADVVRRLRGAGAIVLGKVNLHEFAAGTPDPDSPFGRVQNPRRVGYQSGSSSSGSGAATAAGLGVFSLGTDTGGSVRHPAAVCGLVGLKPTYGRVSVRGVIPLATSLDHVGPLTRSVYDAAAALQAIAGHDPADPYSAAEPVDDYLGALERTPRGLRLGVPTNPMYRDVQPVVAGAYDRALGALVELGLRRHDLELPRAEETVGFTGPVVRTITQAEATAFHARYRDRLDEYNSEMRTRILDGDKHSAVDYIRASEARAEIRRAWERLFESIDLLATPATTAVVPAHGETEVEINGVRYPSRPTVSKFQASFNAVGFPAVVVPCGLSPEGLPLSIQLAAPPFQEARLLAVAHHLEQALGLADRLGIDPAVPGETNG